jgi:hypothetical protein
VSELTTSTDMHIFFVFLTTYFSTDRSFMHESHTVASAVNRDTARCSFQSHAGAAIYSFS